MEGKGSLESETVSLIWDSDAEKWDMELIGQHEMSHILNIYERKVVRLSSLEISRGTWALKWRDGGNLKILWMGWNGYSNRIKYHWFPMHQYVLIKCFVQLEPSPSSNDIRTRLIS